MTVAILSHSDNSSKKYKVIVQDEDRKKTIHFGASGYEDYTIHKDDERKERYIGRHEKNENWNDPFTAGFWSRWLLWNKKTIKQSMGDIHRRFGITFENAK